MVMVLAIEGVLFWNIQFFEDFILVYFRKMVIMLTMFISILFISMSV